MNLKEIKKIVKEEFKDRASPLTISEKWKKIRNYAKIISIIGGLILAAPVTIPTVITSWVSYTVLVSATITGGAYLDKSGKNLKN